MSKVVKFSTEYGLSVQIKDIWHKFGCGIEVEIEPNDDVKEVKERAWNTVIGEVERQMKTVLSEL